MLEGANKVTWYGFLKCALSNFLRVASPIALTKVVSSGSDIYSEIQILREDLPPKLDTLPADCSRTFWCLLVFYIFVDAG